MASKLELQVTEGQSQITELKMAAEQATLESGRMALEYEARLKEAQSKIEALESAIFSGEDANKARD